VYYERRTVQTQPQILGCIFIAIYDIVIRSTSRYVSIQTSCAKAKHNHGTENITTHKYNKKIMKGTKTNIL